MKPIQFKYFNKVLRAEPDKNIGALPVWTDGWQCVSCWKPSWRERLSILLFGRVWLAIMFGSTQPPAALAARRDYFEEVE